MEELKRNKDGSVKGIITMGDLIGEEKPKKQEKEKTKKK